MTMSAAMMPASGTGNRRCADSSLGAASCIWLVTTPLNHNHISTFQHRPLRTLLAGESDGRGYIGTFSVISFAPDFPATPGRSFFSRSTCSAIGLSAGLPLYQDFTFLHLLCDPIQDSRIPLPRGLLYRLSGDPLLLRNLGVDASKRVAIHGPCTGRAGSSSFHISFILGILGG